jgi:hypothetical protein
MECKYRLQVECSASHRQHYLLYDNARCFADRILLVNTYQGDIVDWVYEVFASALGVDGPDELPEVMDASDMSELEKQAWVGFENYILIRDRFAAKVYWQT